MSTEPVPQVPGSAPVVRGLLSEPALPLLLVALVVLVYRGYLPDIGLVAATVLAILVDAWRWELREASARPAPPSSPRLPWWVLCAALATGMAALPRLSRSLDAAFVAVGLVALAITWLPGRATVVGEPHGLAAPPRWRWWPVLGLLTALLEVFSLMYQPALLVDSPDHPSLSTVLEPALGAWPTRTAGLFVWLLAGWWLVRRVRAWAA